MIKIRYFESHKLNLSADEKEYYLNDEPLKVQDSDSTKKRDYTKSEFDAEISKAVSQFVNRSFEHIVLLLGAGASVVNNEEGEIDPEYGKTVAMIAEQVLGQLSSKKYKLPNFNDPSVKISTDVFTLEEMAKDIGYCDNIICTNKYGKRLDPQFNLETFLSRLKTYTQFVKTDQQKWEDSQNAIFDIIKQATSYEYDKSKFKHKALINILSKKLLPENKLSIITTNYDTLIEDAAESMNYTVFDGFSFSRTPKFDDDMFEWHLSKHVSNVKTRENIYKKQVIDLLKIHGSLTWRRDGKDVIRLNKKAPGKTIMIFPSSDKYMQSYEEPYFELFARFQDLLKQPNTLLITTGFSFADNHISRMIIQAISHNPSLSTLIADYSLNPVDPNKNWEILHDMLHDTYPIVFLKATLNEKLTDYLGGIE